MAHKGGLGKGLDALIPQSTESVDTGSTLISIEKIVPNPRQPRQEIVEKDLLELAASIREHGILQPLVVTRADKNNDDFVLIAGERRLRAARLAGLQMVPVVIRQASEQERLELALIENIQRANLSPLETAEAYQQLTKEFNLTHEEIGQQVGKSREAISNTIRLLRLSPAVRDALATGKISEGHARCLLSLEDSHQAQSAVLDSILKLGLSVRQTEELVKKMRGQKAARKPAPAQPPEITELEERLMNHLGTKVTLNYRKKGGSLVIHYYSDEELDAIISHILKDN